MPDVTPSLKQTLIDGALEEARHRPVDQLAQEENEMLLRLQALRETAEEMDWRRAA